MTIEIVAETGISCSLHDQNTVAFDGGKALFRVTAGFIGVGAGLAEHAAGGQGEGFTKFLTHAFGQLIGNLFVVPSCVQTSLKISNIRYIGRSCK